MASDRYTFLYLSDAILCHVLLYFYKLKIYLCNVLFRQSSLARVRMKRESGESPEQSRCCELRFLGLLIETPQSHCPMFLRMGRQGKPE